MMMVNLLVRRFIFIVLMIIVVCGLLFPLSGHVATISAAASSKVLNVKDYGARGDGSTDDTAAVQQALDAAAGRGGQVYFPAGTYSVNPEKTLTVEGNTTIIGDGTSSVIQASKRSFGWEMMRATGSQIEIRNISLDGNMAVNRVLVIGGGSSKVKISKSIVANATHNSNPGSDYYIGVVSGIVVYGNTNQIEIDATEVKNISAVNLTSGSLISRGIYVTTTWGSGEKAAAQVSITNSHIHHIGPADDGDGIYYEDSNLDKGQGMNTNSRIAGNTFDHNAKRAIKIYAQGITVENNRITNSYLNDNFYKGKDKGKPAPDMYSAISVYSSNNTIRNNTIGGDGSYYAAIEVSVSQLVSNVTVEGNQIKMGPKSRVVGTTAIRVGNTKQFTISSNTIENAEKGIWTWHNAENGSIADNRIQTTKGGIDLSTYLDHCVQKDIVVKDNSVKSKSDPILLAKSNVNVEVVEMSSS
ncbi:glycosyl hydrolase family 28-related protein [Paenibacillus aceti]|nr:glycosyl hydrolase family 28-related protein [Paenibacillus aceti]